MNTLRIEATRFSRQILLAIAFYILIIVITIMTMVLPAHARGVVQGSTSNGPRSDYPTGSYTYSPYYYTPQAIGPPESAYNLPITLYIQSTAKGITITTESHTYQGVEYPNGGDYQGGYISYDLYLIGNYGPGGSTVVMLRKYKTLYPTAYSATVSESVVFDIAAAVSAITQEGDKQWANGGNTCPAHATGTPCTCETGYMPDPSATNCVLEQYTIKLDLKNATIEPSTTAQNTKTAQEFVATVTDNNNVAKAGAKVTIKTEVEQGSGGHVHKDEIQRPKGYLGRGTSATLCDPNALQPQACIFGTTDPNGQFTFVFSSPEPSGKHTITATCDVCKDNQDQAKITVKVEGLVSLSGSSTDYVLVGDTPTHSDNHYLTPTAKALAERLAIEYRKKFPKSPRLHFNDASLIEGGVLDICTEKETSAGCAYNLRYNPICQLQPNGTYACSWSRPHIEHRRGSVIDVRANNVDSGADNYATSIPRRNETDFLKLAEDIGVDTGTAPHSPNSSNRHWHIRLLGVAE